LFTFLLAIKKNTKFRLFFNIDGGNNLPLQHAIMLLQDALVINSLSRLYRFVCTHLHLRQSSQWNWCNLAIKWR